jgi:hypothetical protein
VESIFPGAVLGSEVPFWLIASMLRRMWCWLGPERIVRWDAEPGGHAASFGGTDFFSQWGRATPV